ncbi:MAG: hypothetical protein AAF544_02705, partial [Bacteroidota bacterium]
MPKQSKIIYFASFILLATPSSYCISQDIVSKSLASLINKFWENAPCNSQERLDFLDTLLGNPPLGSSPATIISWLGHPLHKRKLTTGRFIYVYLDRGSPPSETCPYSDLLCFGFNEDKSLESIFLFFILESEEAVEFWYSSNLPTESIQGGEDESMYKKF